MSKTFGAQRIYAHRGGYCLGDCITLVNYLLHESQTAGAPVIVSRHFPPKPESKETAYGLMDRIAAMLDSKGHFVWTDEPGNFTTEQFRIWSPPGGYRRLPLKPWLRWNGGTMNAVAIQLNGHSGGANKNPTTDDCWRLETVIKNKGVDVIKLGLPMSLEQSISIMRQCKLFIGVCSAMSHLAHACGIPTIIIEYRLAITPWHPAPDDEYTPWHYARGTNRAMTKALELLCKT